MEVAKIIIDSKFLIRIGTRIKDLRERNRFTQEQLAEMTDLSPRSISGIEAGSQDVSITNFYKIAKALNTTFSYLIYGEYDFNSEKIIEMFKECPDKKIEKIETIIKMCIELLNP